MMMSHSSQPSASTSLRDMGSCGTALAGGVQIVAGFSAGMLAERVIAPA